MYTLSPKQNLLCVKEQTELFVTGLDEKIKSLEFSFALKIFSLLNFFQLSGQGEGGDEAVAVRQDEHWGCCELDMGGQ